MNIRNLFENQITQIKRFDGIGLKIQLVLKDCKVYFTLCYFIHSKQLPF